MQYGEIKPEDIREDEKIVRVTDSRGKCFERGWKAGSADVSAVRWTIESVDLPYYCIDIDKIEIIRGTKPEDDYATKE